VSCTGSYSKLGANTSDLSACTVWFVTLLDLSWRIQLLSNKQPEHRTFAGDKTFEISGFLENSGSHGVNRDTTPDDAI